MSDTTVLLESAYNVSIDVPNNTVVTIGTDNSVLSNIDSTVTATIENNANTLVDTPIVHTVVAGGSQGPQGIPGASTQSVWLPSGIAVGGNRVVATNSLGSVVYPDMSVQNNTIIGVTHTSANNGEMVEIQIFGIMTEPSWEWQLDTPVFIGSNGLLTQVPPSSGLIQIIGYPVTPTKLFIDKQSPVFLG